MAVAGCGAGEDADLLVTAPRLFGGERMIRDGAVAIRGGEIVAIVREAHTHDLRVTAHVGESRGARMALRAGVDELAHMPCEDDAELMRELARSEVEIVGTLHVLEASRAVGSSAQSFRVRRSRRHPPLRLGLRRQGDSGGRTTSPS